MTNDEIFSEIVKDLNIEAFNYNAPDAPTSAANCLIVFSNRLANLLHGTKYADGPTATDVIAELGNIEVMLEVIRQDTMIHRELIIQHMLSEHDKSDEGSARIRARSKKPWES